MKITSTIWKKNWSKLIHYWWTSFDSNIWFSTKVIDVIEKKFQSVFHHHKNVVKSAQHHCLAPGPLPCDVLGGIIEHIVDVAQKKN
jgi:hypothetical protein